MEEHSRRRAKHVEDVRKGNVIPSDKLEFVYPVVPSSCVNFKCSKKCLRKRGTTNDFNFCINNFVTLIFAYINFVHIK